MLAVVLTTLEIISSLTFSFALSSMETIVVPTGWLVFISIFNYFTPT